MKKEADEWKLHRMAKIHNILEMWQGSLNLHATQRKSRARNKHMTAVVSISDTEEILKASWSLLEHDGAAAFKLSARSPLPLPLSAKYLPGGQTQVENVCQIRGINCHPVESYADSIPESISPTEDWLHWNGDLDNPNDSKNHCAVDAESDIEQDDSIEDPEGQEQRDVSTAPNVPRLIRPTWESKSQAEAMLMTVNAIDTRMNKGVKHK